MNKSDAPKPRKVYQSCPVRNCICKKPYRPTKAEVEAAINEITAVISHMEAHGCRSVQERQVRRALIAANHARQRKER